MHHFYRGKCSNHQAFTFSSSLNVCTRTFRYCRHSFFVHSGDQAARCSAMSWSVSQSSNARCLPDPQRIHSILKYGRHLQRLPVPQRLLQIRENSRFLHRNSWRDLSMAGRVRSLQVPRGEIRAKVEPPDRRNPLRQILNNLDQARTRRSTMMSRTMYLRGPSTIPCYHIDSSFNDKRQTVYQL